MSSKDLEIDMWDKLRTLWHSGRTRRYHTIPSVEQQSVADHTWGTLIILDRILPRNHPSYFPIMCYLIYHDSAEIIAGDLPAPAKLRSPLIREAMRKVEAEVMEGFGIEDPTLNEEEQRIAKVCDMAETFLYSLWQANDCGRPAAMDVARTALHILDQLEMKHPTAAKLIEILKGMKYVGRVS